jgi:hypothetical protein
MEKRKRDQSNVEEKVVESLSPSSSHYLDVLYENALTEVNQMVYPLVDLKHLIAQVVSYSYQELISLSELLVKRSTSERKQILMEYVINVRKDMLKLYILSEWSEEVDDWIKIKCFERLATVLADYFREAADALVNVHASLAFARTPNFDIAASIDILSGRGYPRLPSCIKQMIPPSNLTDKEEMAVIERLNRQIQGRLLTCNIPVALVYVRTEDGCVVFRREHEFEFGITLVREDNDLQSCWSMVYVIILVQSDETMQTELELDIKYEDEARGGGGGGLGRRLTDSMQQNMISSYVKHDPFRFLSIHLHNVSMAYGLELLYHHSMMLLKSRWSDETITVDYVPRSLLKITYWEHATTVATESHEKRTMLVTLRSMLPADDIIMMDHDEEEGTKKKETWWESYIEIGHSIPEVDQAMRLSPWNYVIRVNLHRLNAEILLNKVISLHAFLMLTDIQKSLMPLFQKSMVFALNLKHMALISDGTQENYVAICLKDDDFDEEKKEIRILIDRRTGHIQIRWMGCIDVMLQKTLKDVQRKVDRQSMTVVGAIRTLLIHDLQERLAKALFPLETISTMPLQTTTHEEKEQGRDRIPPLSYSFFIRYHDCHHWLWMIELDENGLVKLTLVHVTVVSKYPLLVKWIESMECTDSYMNYFLGKGSGTSSTIYHLHSLEHIIQVIQRAHYSIRGLELLSYLHSSPAMTCEWSHSAHVVEYQLTPQQPSSSILMCNQIRLKIFEDRIEGFLVISRDTCLDLSHIKLSEVTILVDDSSK